MKKVTFGKVLGIKTGLNPNSSSLGANTTWLLVWSAGLTVIAPVLSVLVRGLAAVKGKRNG